MSDEQQQDETKAPETEQPSDPPASPQADGDGGEKPEEPAA